MATDKKHVVIVGGGFAGVSLALTLEEKASDRLQIALIADSPHFEYHAALYRLVTGSSPLEVCIPLREIFSGKKVDVVEDQVALLNRDERVVIGSSGSHYHYDYLVLALGSETNYFGIPGLKEYSHGMKSTTEALRLQEHVAQVLLGCRADFASKPEQVCDANFVVIGAGATGVEMAGQLVVFARNLAKKYGIDPTLVSVELIEGASKILPLLPAKFTDRIEHHLRGLGVNIFLNRTIERTECREVFLKDMEMKARTVIWTAGVRANAFYEAWKLPVDEHGRVEVDAQLRLKDDARIFVVGDGAATKYSGWAQTAMYDGRYVARAIIATLQGASVPTYDPKPPVNAIPVGPKWAAVLWGGVRIYGSFGWLLRRCADFRTFLEILPLGKAWKAFKNGSSICEACSICLPEQARSQLGSAPFPDI